MSYVGLVIHEGTLGLQEQPQPPPPPGTARVAGGNACLPSAADPSALLPQPPPRPPPAANRSSALAPTSSSMWLALAPSDGERAQDYTWDEDSAWLYYTDQDVVGMTWTTEALESQ